MKKLLTLLLVLFMLPCAAMAELDEDGDVLVTLAGVEFFFTLPEGAYMLSPESSASAFDVLGLSQREMLPWMEERNITVLFIDEHLGWELQVVAYPVQSGDFDDMSEFWLERERNAIAYQYRDQGWEVFTSEAYRAPEGHQFVFVDAVYEYEDGSLEPQLEYYTIKGGVLVSIYMIGCTEHITEEQRVIAQDIADTLWIMPR